MFFKYVIDQDHVYRDCVAVGNTGKYVVIDSRDTCDAGYETMVFESSADGEVLNWSELDIGRYENWQDMEKGHKSMCEKWKRKEDMKCIYEEIFGSSED